MTIKEACAIVALLVGMIAWGAVAWKWLDDGS